MIRILTFIALVLLAAPVARTHAQALGTAPVDSIVAVVDEDVILRSELDRAIDNVRIQFTRNPGQLPPDDVLERQVLERLILLRLQLERAQSTGIRITDADLDTAIQAISAQNNLSPDALRSQVEADGFTFDEFRASLREEMMVQRLRTRFMQSRVAVSETEVDILLASSKGRTGQIRAANILIALPDGATAEQIETAREKIAGVKKLIDEGMDFAAAAIRYSNAPNALDGGDLGWRGYDEVPAVFAEILSELPVGGVSDPVRGPSGFHLVKLLERRDDSQHMITEYRVRDLLVRETDLLPPAEAEAKIRALRARIVAGEDFAEVARAESDNTMSAAKGGDLGWVDPSTIGREIATVLASLPENSVSEPIRTPFGWYLIEKLETRQQDRTDDVIRGQAREQLRRRKSEEEFERFLRQSRDEAYVDIRLGN